MNLFKRSKNPDAPWTLRFECLKRQYVWSTKTSNLALAKVRARDYMDKVKAGQFNLVDAMKSRNGSARFGEVFAHYLTLPAPELLTKKRNIAAMRAVLKVSGLTDTDRVDRLGSQIAMAYQAHIKQTRPGSNSAIVSANAAMRRSRSIFSKAALLAYKGILSVPKGAVEDYYAVPFLKEARPMKIVPSATSVTAAVARLKTMPDHYRAFLLAAVAGCRAGEIKEARRTWVDGAVLKIGAFPDEYFPKSGRERRITIPEAAIEILLGGEDPVWLVGPRRVEIVERELPAILKECGFTDRKPIHSLRRLFGSQLFSAQGAAVAKEACGWANIATGERHYLNTLNEQKPVPMPA